MIVELKQMLKKEATWYAENYAPKKHRGEKLSLADHERANELAKSLKWGDNWDQWDQDAYSRWKQNSGHSWDRNRDEKTHLATIDGCKKKVEQLEQALKDAKRVLAEARHAWNADQSFAVQQSKLVNSNPRLFGPFETLLDEVAMSRCYPPTPDKQIISRKDDQRAGLI